MKQSTKLRLAFCNATHSWGGVKTWTLEFARALTDIGHEVHILGRDPRFLERAASLNLPAYSTRFGPDFNPFAIRRCMRFFRHHHIDAVLVNVGQDLRSAGVAAHLSGLPLVQRIGMPDDMRPTRKVRLLNLWLAPHYLCPCRFIADGLQNTFPDLSPTRLTVIHSAKSIPAFSLPPAHTPLRFVTTSQLNPDKGHLHLLPVLAELKNAGYRFEWHVAGTGDQEEKIKALCTQLHLDEYVHFHGFTQNVGELLKTCDVFLLPSLTEGLPNTLLEAMSYGLVPVACAVGGTEEAWPSHLPQLLVAPWGEKNATHADMKQALLHVLTQSDETLQDWKKKTWAHCREHFSLPCQAQKLSDYFLSLVSKARQEK